MRKLFLVMGVLGSAGLWIAACDSDVETSQPSTGGAAGMGGSGGSGGGDAGNGGSAGEGGGEVCGGPFVNICEEACCQIETVCGITGACSQLEGLTGFTCGDPELECVGTTLLAEQMANPSGFCSAILALATGMGDEMFVGDILSCLSTDPCLQCGAQSCPNEAFACQAAEACTAFLQCVQMNACMDAPCIDGCRDMNQSPETTALYNCVAENCTETCLGAGGAGGGGGAGGAGGAGGS
jgi:hypothetical protein